MLCPCLADVENTFWATGLNSVRSSTSSSMYNVKIHARDDRQHLSRVRVVFPDDTKNPEKSTGGIQLFRLFELKVFTLHES
jgi:hypothetical protein